VCLGNNHFQSFISKAVAAHYLLFLTDYLSCSTAVSQFFPPWATSQLNKQQNAPAAVTLWEKIFLLEHDQVTGHIHKMPGGTVSC